MFPPAHFFPDTRFNLSEVLLRRASEESINDSIAIIAVREGHHTSEHVSWREMRDRVGRVYDAMSNCGIQEGDRIAAVVCNSVESVVICLATLALGAVYSSTSPDMGAEAIVQRFGQIKPKLVFTESGYVYGGRTIPLVSQIKAWGPKLRSAPNQNCQIVLLPHQGTYPHERLEATTWKDFLALGSGKPLLYKQLPFSSPAFVLYTSGTVRVLPVPIWRRF